MTFQKLLNLFRLFVGATLLLTGVASYAAPPNGTDGSFTADEDQFTAICPDLSAMFTDPDGDTIDSYAYAGSTGDPLSSDVVLPGSCNNDPVAEEIARLDLVPDANGTETYTFEATDSNGETGSVQFTLTLNPVNDSFTVSGPVDLGALYEDNSRVISQEDLLATTSDVDGDVVAQGLTSDSGTLTDNGDGTWTFTPDEHWNGTVGFDYSLTDGTDTVANTASLTVSAVNDAPVVAPVDLGAIDEDTSRTITQADLLAGATDADGDSLTAENLLLSTGMGTLTDHLDGTWTFEPDPDWNGAAEFTYDVSDGTTSTANTASLAVNSVNDAPVAAAVDLGAIDEDTSRTISQADLLDGATDADGDSLTAENLLLSAGMGTLTDHLDGTWTFEPDPDWNGAAEFSYDVSDGTTSTANTATLTVDVVNDVPIANEDTATMDEDGDAITIMVMNNDYLAEEPTTLVSAGVDGHSETEPVVFLDQQGDPIVGPDGDVAPNGQVTVQGNDVVYQPKPNFNGTDTFTYTISDSDGDTATGMVTVTVNPVNDPPEGRQEWSYDMLENGVLVVTETDSLLRGAYDVDGAQVDPDTGEPIGGVTFSVQRVPGVIAGSLTLDQATGTFEYQPPVDFTGTVEFEYRVSDGSTLSVGDAYRAVINIYEAPEPPAPPPPGEVVLPFNLSQVPLEESTSVPPNVLVVMDDSGSMDWNLIVSGAGQDGGFELNNRDYSNRRRASTSYTYLWDLRNNAYPPTSGNGHVLATDEALDAEATLEGWFTPNPYGVWRARNHQHNRLYYNPEIQYEPWVGQDATNAAFANADPTAVRLDPRDPRDTFNILAPHSYRSVNVPEWDSNGGRETVFVNDLYIPHYYSTTATPPLAPDDPHTKVEILAVNEPFVGGPEREDCAIDDGDPTTCTYEQEIQNFANYFQYYRSREYVTKNGIGSVISQVQDVRIGYLTISATTLEDVRDMNTLHTEGNKKTLMDNIYRVDSFGGTPLRQALGRAGDIFACDRAGDCPALPAPEGFCQQNFALLFSDGYWNGGTGTSGNPDGDGDSNFDGGRYADNTDATLADVAMHYYETDLHPTLDDEVPVMRRDVDGVPDGVFPDSDARMHQHMKTYTISFGVSGSVDPGDVPSDPVTPFSWPNPFDGNLEKIDDMLHTAVNGRGRFLNASSPRELQAAFEAAFLEFTQAASSTSSAAFNSTSVREDTLIYRAFYDLRDNTGELTATPLDPVTGALADEPVWRASERLEINPSAAECQAIPRTIVTYDAENREGILFDFSTLTDGQLLTLNSDEVDFLHGIRDNEQPDGVLRQRPACGGLLGDIVNSSPVYVGTPRSINRDQAPFPTSSLYSSFVDQVEDRTPVVYVGANDGMLHGFNGDTGEELYAYVPNKIIDGTERYHNSLETYTSPFYQHRYYVDLTPELNDVFMRESTTAIGKSWNTVLVGGLGAGGKGFFSLNVTDPDDFTDAGAPSTVLWEFTDEDDTYPMDASGNPLGGSVGAVTDPSGRPVKDLGYSLSLPSLVMSNVGGATDKDWVAIFGNGANSTAGIAKLFVLFMDHGLNGWDSGDFVKLHTGYGVQSPPHPLAGLPNGLGSPASVDVDLNGTVDWVYAGDRLGNLFRFDLSDSNPSNWDVTRVFTASFETAAGETTVQPILTQPLVIAHPDEQGFLVIFGTGSHLTRDDAESEDIQSVYAIWDRGSSSPPTAQSNTKADRLVEQTITNVVDDSVSPAQTRRIVTREPVDYRPDDGSGPGTYGWYVDLDVPRASTTLSGASNPDTSGRAPPGPQYPGEKAIRRILHRDGVLVTTTVLPALDEFSCFGTRPGAILLFDAVTGGDPRDPVVDFNRDETLDESDLVEVGGELFAGGLLIDQHLLDGQLVDLAVRGGQDTDFLYVSGGNETTVFRIRKPDDGRTGRLSWRELDAN